MRQTYEEAVCDVLAQATLDKIKVIAFYNNFPTQVGMIEQESPLKYNIIGNIMTSGIDLHDLKLMLNFATGEVIWEKPRFPVTEAIADRKIEELYNQLRAVNSESLTIAGDVAAATIQALAWLERDELEEMSWDFTLGRLNELNQLYEKVHGVQFQWHLERISGMRDLFTQGKRAWAVLRAADHLK